jgi:molybdate transport system ATP-binding protein
MSQPLIQLDNVSVALNGNTILHGITWRLLPGEHWAIMGANGSGKSTLLKLIRGELWPAPERGGRRVYAFDGDGQTTAVGIKEKIALVSPELQGRYLQQEWRLSALQVIHSGFLGGDYVYQKLTSSQKDFAQTIISLIGITALLSRNVQELSTGELRKVLIARALTGAPRVLVCDELCDGLDAVSRNDLLEILGSVALSGTQLLYTTHRPEELVPAITHRLVLDQGRIVNHGAAPPESKFDIRNSQFQSPPATAVALRPERFEAKESVEASRRSLIHIEDASVFLGINRAPVLQEINLQIRAGENWAILGPNGAGKTTLLKLIIGDVHPALGGRVRRFEFTARNTLWEVKRRIGYISPELQSNYRESLTGSEVIASGFFSSIGLMQPVGREQQRRVCAIIESLRLEDLARRNLLQMSYGEVRKILLARALVHDPALLICDEPFDGLDAASRAEMVRSLANVARKGTGLILVTHHAGDLPIVTTHVAELKRGRLIFQGTVEGYRKP